MGIAVQGGWWLRGERVSLTALFANTLWPQPVLTNAEQDTLLAMAQSCPFIWGDFVYKARAFVAYHDTTQALMNECEILNEAPELRLAEKEAKKNLTDMVRISPNPAREYVLVSGILNGSEIMIYDIVGNVKLRRMLEGGTQSVSLKHLRSGVYFFRIILPDGSEELKKLVITE